MRFHRHRRRRSRGKKQQKTVEEIAETESIEPLHPRQPYDAFLVLDIEGTCKLGTDFNYPNEIIEFPVCVMEWKDKDEDGTASVLEITNEFRTFVKPTWRPQLSDFCKELTGISQEQVDAAPNFAEVLIQLEAFLVDNGLIEEGTGKRLKKFCWCSDGPFDIRDFVVKQCFISNVEMPLWVQGDVLDVRSSVLQWMTAQTNPPTTPMSGTPPSIATTRRALNIAAQLQVLDLPPFEGRQHSGIDDTRNISKVVSELARRGVCLLPNTAIHPGRRWKWMGKPGQVLEVEV
ncbi:ribonuclease H-like domain-containing protein [Panaeolus papilionaceus]|nr:ribonuclease H-like domain-containing protein [Panaeolus papilionaceus]